MTTARYPCRPASPLLAVLYQQVRPRHTFLFLLSYFHQASACVGALSGYTSRLLTSNTFKSVRDVAKAINNFFPDDIKNINKRVDEYVRGMATGGTLFEELGFYYVGPVDAHDLDNLIPILENIRDNVPLTKPVLLHVKSIKGKGYPPAEAASDKMHGVARFDLATGKQKVIASKTPSYTNVFANSLIAIAEQDKTVVAMTAAMPGGTGLDKFGRRFPKRCFDVGIAEQHGTRREPSVRVF